jgi:hypothetical protein
MKRSGRDCRSYTSDCLYGLSLFIENFKELLPCQVRNHLVAFKPSPYHSTKPVWCVTTAATRLNDFKPVFRHSILPVAGTENITAYFSDLWDGYSGDRKKAGEMRRALDSGWSYLAERSRLCKLPG